MTMMRLFQVEAGRMTGPLDVQIPAVEYRMVLELGDMGFLWTIEKAEGDTLRIVCRLVVDVHDMLKTLATQAVVDEVVARSDDFYQRLLAAVHLAYIRARKRASPD